MEKKESPDFRSPEVGISAIGNGEISLHVKKMLFYNLTRITRYV